MKKYLLGLFAIVLAIGFTAFTTNPAPQVGQWYDFVGTSTSEHDDLDKYEPASPAECPQEVRLCQIFIEDGSISQGELDALIDLYGDGTSFTAEEPGVVEFKQ